MDYQLIAPRLPELSVVEQVFHNRGIEKENIQHYLFTTDDDLIDPLKIDRIKDGAQMLIKHIAAQDKTLIQVDSDCDGYTSSALLINYLNQFFPAWVQNCLSYRVHPDKEHGLILDTIPEDVKLVIAPDSSSNDYEVHKALHDRGCDVLVIDHHLADHVSEYACIINNQMCDYPTKTLSGVGMVYKFCSYLDELMGEHMAQEYTDLAAVGIVADVMDLRDYETRHIIELGMASQRNPFIREMMKKQEFKIQGKLNPFNIGFYIAPFVNAVNRSGTLEERILLFESMLEYKAFEQIPSTKRGCKGLTETRVEQAVRTASNVKNRQGKTRDAAQEIIENIIQKNNLLDHVLLAIRLSKEFAVDRNLTGLIATQLANKYGHPTIILNETYHDNEQWWEGSMRGAPNIPIKDTRQILLDTNLIEYCEGHANAAGVGIKNDNFDLLINYIDQQYKDIEFTPSYLVDAILPYNNDLGSNVLDVASYADYWGEGIREPIFAFTNIRINKDNCQMMKSNTFKITCGDLSFIKFKMPDEDFEQLYTEQGWKELTIIGTCHINEWGGGEYPQVIIEDYEINRSFNFDF